MTSIMETAVAHAVTRPDPTDLLLRHFRALGVVGERRVPVGVRLEQAIGPEFARRLVSSLTFRSAR
jgi:hypothetical protein